MLCVFLALGAAPQFPRSDPDSWFETTQPFRIVGPVHYVGTRGLDAYLITTPAGYILIDGAMSASASDIEPSIRSLGYKPQEIRLLLNHPVRGC